jgi:hypothetical protein
MLRVMLTTAQNPSGSSGTQYTNTSSFSLQASYRSRKVPNASQRDSSLSRNQIESSRSAPVPAWVLRIPARNNRVFSLGCIQSEQILGQTGVWPIMGSAGLGFRMVGLELKDLRRRGKFSVWPVLSPGFCSCGGLFASAPASWSAVVLHRCGSGPQAPEGWRSPRRCRVTRSPSRNATFGVVRCQGW